MRYVLFISLFFSLSLETLAQKCERPEAVFLKLNSLDSALATTYLGNVESRIYLQDSSEVFVRTSEINEIKKNEYLIIQFQTIDELRNEAQKIRRCEIQKASETVYLDIDVNSIFKKIYMILIKDQIIYKFQVRWVDGIE